MKRVCAVLVMLAASGCSESARNPSTPDLFFEDVEGQDSGIVDDMADLDGTEDSGMIQGWVAIVPITRGARQETAVFEHNNEVWVLGGFDDRATMLTTVEIYSPDSGTWRAGPQLPIAMHHANATVVNGSAWILGFLVGGFSADGRIFELVDDAWVPRGTMPAERRRGASVLGVDGTKVYVVGGLDGGAVSRFDRYDTARGEWETLPNLPAVMDHGAGAFLGDTMVVAGGRAGTLQSHTNAVHIFDFGQNSWKQGAPMPTSRAGVAYAVHEGHLFVFGGEGNSAEASGVFGEVESYDPSLDAWQSHPVMPRPRHGMGAASVGGVIVVPGGAEVQAFGATDFVDGFIP